MQPLCFHYGALADPHLSCPPHGAPEFTTSLTRMPTAESMLERPQHADAQGLPNEGRSVTLAKITHTPAPGG